LGRGKNMARWALRSTGMPGIALAALLAVLWASAGAGGCWGARQQPGNRHPALRPAAPGTIRPADGEQAEGAGVGGARGSASPGASPRRPSHGAGQRAAGDGELRAIPRIYTSREAALREALAGPSEGQSATAAAGAAAGLRPGAGAAAGALVLEDFRDGLHWRPVRWPNANACRVSLVETPAGAAMRLECLEGEEQKAGAVREFAEPVDLSRFGRVEVRVRLVGGEAEALAIGWLTDKYYESAPKPLVGAGEASVAFSLLSRSYKAAPRWAYDVSLGSRGEARALFLLVYGGRPCAMLVREVRLLGGLAGGEGQGR